MKYYVTTYALTQGILHVTGRVSEDNKYMYYGKWHQQAKPGDWHINLGSAKIKADRMRLRKISSMKAGIAKLEAMEISVVAMDGVLAKDAS